MSLIKQRLEMLPENLPFFFFFWTSSSMQKMGCFPESWKRSLRDVMCATLQIVN